jgi:hypothetical protein
LLKVESDCSNYNSLPRLGFKLGDKILNLRPDDYVDRSSSSSCDFSLMALDVPPPKGPVFIFGDPFLRRFVTIFDRKESRVGFAVAKQSGDTGSYDDIITTVGGGHADVGSSASAVDLSQATSLVLDGGMMTSDSGSDSGSSDDEATTTVGDSLSAPSDNKATAAAVADNSPPANPEVADKSFDSMGDAPSTTEAASTTTSIDFSAYLKDSFQADSGSADEASTTTASQATTAADDDSKYFNPDSSAASSDVPVTTTAALTADEATATETLATENTGLDGDATTTTTADATDAPVQQKRNSWDDIFGRSGTESEPFGMPAGETAKQYIDSLPEAPVTTTSAAAADNNAVAAMAQMFNRHESLLLQQKKAGKHNGLVSVKLYKRK